MALLPTVEALNLGEVFLIFWDGIDAHRRWVLASSPSTPRASAVVLLWVGGGGLLSGRYLFLTRCVSRGGVGGLILSTGVLLLLPSGPVPSRTPRVHVAGTGGGLEHRLCLRVDGFLHGLFPGVQVPASGIHLGPDGRFQAFQEASDHDPPGRSCFGIELSENRLQVLQVGCPVEDFLLLVLGVPLELSPVDVHKGLRVTQASSKECLELVSRDRDRGFGVMSPLVLLPAEANLIPQEKPGKRNPGRSYGSSGSKIVLILLTEVIAVHVRLSAI